MTPNFLVMNPGLALGGIVWQFITGDVGVYLLQSNSNACVFDEQLVALLLYARAVQNCVEVCPGQKGDRLSDGGRAFDNHHVRKIQAKTQQMRVSMTKAAVQHATGVAIPSFSYLSAYLSPNSAEGCIV